MSSKLKLLAVLFLIQTVLSQGDETEAQIDEFIETLMSCQDIPGVSLTVIREGQDYISKGYGVKDTSTGEPMTNLTLLNVNSVTKAFIGVAAAIVVKNYEELSWDTPVREILGDGFYMNDSTRSQQLTLVDAISHRAGLRGHNQLRVNGYTAEELVMRVFQHLDFVADFRHDYQYNNLMYSIPAYVIEHLTGQSFEDYVRDNILMPLDMEYSGFITDPDLWPAVAKGYRPDNEAEGQLREVDIVVSKAYYQSVLGAGGLLTNALDMRQWIKFQLNQGTTGDGVEILTPDEFQETHRQHNHLSGLPGYRRPFYPVTYAPPSGYSLGWEETTYRDYILQQHTGGLNAYNSLLMIFPDAQHGIFISFNRAVTGDAKAFIGMFIADLLLGEEPWLNKDTVCDMFNSDFHRNRRSHEVIKHSFHSNIRFSQKQEVKKTKWIHRHLYNNKHGRKFHKLVQKHLIQPQKPDYMGTYGNYAYGNLTIDSNGEAYTLSYGVDGFIWNLEPVEENLFSAIGQEPVWYQEFTLEFERNPGEEASAVMATFNENDPPIRFERYLDWKNLPNPPDLC